MVRIIAYHVAENLNIKKFKADYAGELISSSSFELFYRYKSGFFYLLSYGVVVLANVDEIDATNLLTTIKRYTDLDLSLRYQEDFTIEQNNGVAPSFSYNSLSVPTIKPDLIRIVMLQVGQSAALDFYAQKSQDLLNEIVKLTQQLEEYGKLKTSKKNLLKIIGRTLSTKNRIIDDLYILDAPPVVWEDELLDKVNEGLIKTFDINIRFREVEYMLKNVESNLSVFIELINTRQSHLLEWVVIILILIEVIHLFVAQFTG
jgi:uncharacterized Rmd1/YagE family protein